MKIQSIYTEKLSLCIIYKMGIVVLKNTISEVNSLHRINSRLEPESEGFSKFVAKSAQNIQTKA